MLYLSNTRSNQGNRLPNWIGPAAVIGCLGAAVSNQAVRAFNKFARLYQPGKLRRGGDLLNDPPCFQSIFHPR